MSRLYAIILAGGSGTRLWPLSRQRSPKHLLNVAGYGDTTLLQDTIGRLRPRVPPERMIFLASQEFLSEVRRQAFEFLGRDADLCTFIGEPVGRNTAPAILLGAMVIAHRDPDGLVLAVPSDHVINDSGAFLEAVDRSLDAAGDGYIVTYGLVPTRPETGYGYILSGDRRGEVLAVERFEEKPDRERAEAFLREGRHYWNSGIFLFSAATIIEEASQFLPDLVGHLRRLSLESLDNLAEIYGDIDPVSIDYGIMERTHRAAVLPVKMEWSDVGSWDSLYEIAEKDGRGNVVRGEVIHIDSDGSFLMTGQRLMTAIGVKDVIAVDTDDAVLVCARGRSQEVREVIDRLEERGRSEHIEHRTVRKPWGSYTVLEPGDGYHVKRITVDPGQKLSLQAHRHRSEHWVVVAGTALATVGDRQVTLSANESVFIPVGEKHRLENPGRTLLELIEVQYGDVISEEDIVRFEDMYGRIGKKED
ncbi:MAG: mannose-1-phosphate guanylyltransferase/mannose-6-phosphate isomerase [bacterium]|nr:MAG: mannose-1-phosphate guanylyltransferase/mannose-6-phosphate isomerase [bacterium]